MKTNSWLKFFRLTDIGPKEPSFADEIEVLPGASLTVDGQEFYRECDRGRVSRVTYVDESDGVQRFEVTWYRTGLTSTMKTSAWLQSFRAVETFSRFAEIGKKPRCGDELQALPGAQLTVSGVVFYSGGDKGRVTRDIYTDVNDGVKRFHVSWYRTGQTSTMTLRQWPASFRLIDHNSEMTAEEILWWHTVTVLKLNVVPKKTSLPSGLRSLTFGGTFNNNLQGVEFPSNLQTLTFGHRFNQSLQGVVLPKSLQCLRFGDGFNMNMDDVALPDSLQCLVFGQSFNRSMDNVSLPIGLKSLTFGDDFNQPLGNLSLPDGLQNLTLGRCFKQTLEPVTFPSNLLITY